MKFDGDTAYYIPPKTITSGYPITNLFDRDFTYCFRFRVDWKELHKKQSDINGWARGGIMIKTGAHFGLQAVVGVDAVGNFLKALEVITWTNSVPGSSIYNDENKLNSMKVDINSSLSAINWDGWMQGTLVSDHNKSLTLYIDNYADTLELTDPLLDYSDSYLYVGCYDSHAADCFVGDVSHVGIFQKKFTKEDINLFFSNLDDLSKLTTYMEILYPVALTDFKRKTIYKLYDMSENGNHFIKYDREILLGQSKKLTEVQLSFDEMFKD